MKLAMVVVLVLLVVSLLPGCTGVSQEEYDSLKADINEKQVLISQLQTLVARKQNELQEINNQLKTQKAEPEKLQEEIDAKDIEIDILKKEIEGRKLMIDSRESALREYEYKIAELEEQLQISQTQVPKFQLPENRTIADCVEPTDSSVRKQALSIVANTPSGINADSESWKIWAIYYWVSQNITYVTDPKGNEYFAYAHETLEIKAGDCDDFSILLASMYESVGLDSALAEMDTDNETGVDHMTCFVYWSSDSQSFLDDEKTILDKKGLTTPTKQVYVRYWDAGTSHPVLGKYDEGIWIVADGTMNDIRGMVGYITREPYKAYEIIDVGS